MKTHFNNNLHILTTSCQITPHHARNTIIITPLRTTSHYTASYYAIQHNITPHHVTSHKPSSPHHTITSNHIMHATPHHRHHATSHHTTPSSVRHFAPHHAIIISPHYTASHLTTSNHIKSHITSHNATSHYTTPPNTVLAHYFAQHHTTS